MIRLMSCLMFAAVVVACTATTPAVEEYGHPLKQPLPEELRGPVVFEGRGDGHWTHPGDHPFSGDINSALIAVGVINDAERARLASRIAHVEPDDTLCVSRKGFASHRPNRDAWLYAPNMAMTFGEKTVVYNMIVNFSGQQCGHLYVQGPYHIWVPFICGNVSRIMPAFEADRYARSNRPDVIGGGPGNSWASRLAYRWRGGGGIGDRRGQPYQPIPEAADGQVYDVPEPSTLALLFLGSGMLLFAARRKSVTLSTRRDTPASTGDTHE